MSFKPQEEFDTKSKSFVRYINDNNIKLSEDILDDKYKSFTRLINGTKIGISTYIAIIKKIEENSKKKFKSKLPSRIISKFKLTEKVNRSEIITFDFNTPESFTDFLYSYWEQEQEQDFIEYKERFKQFVDKEDKKFLKNKFIDSGFEQSLSPKCEIKLQNDPEIQKNLSVLLDDFVAPAFRYGLPHGAQWKLSARSLLETRSKYSLDFLFSKNIKISAGQKRCPQPIFLSQPNGVISLKAKYIWVIKFGETSSLEINNPYTDNQIFEQFRINYLSK